MSQQQSFSSPVGPGTAIQNVIVQTGAFNPVVPAGGSITLNGVVVAAGTHPIRTDGTAASVTDIEVQTSQAIAATDATKIGLAAFDSASFTVDANGFVQLKTQLYGAVTTTGAQTLTLLTIPTANNSVTTVECHIAGYGTPIGVGADAGIGGTIDAVFITGIVNTNPIDVIDYSRQSSLGNLCTFVVTDSGTNIIVQVTGDAAYIINWVCDAYITEAP